MGYNIWPKIISSTTFGQSQKQQLQHHPSISIELLESILYSHQAHHPVLRGAVEFKSKTPIVVSSLRLDFHGHLDFRLVKPDITCQKKFAECSLPLYPTSPTPPSSLSNPLIIQDQRDKPTRFVFEMPILSNTTNANTTTNNNHLSSLIQSIQCNEFQVNYQIKAILEYHHHPIDTTTITSSLVNNKKRKNTKSVIIHKIESPSYPIVIIQIPTYDDGSTIFTSDNMLASIDSRKQSNKWCQYVVQIDKRFAAISSNLCLSVRLAPLIHGLKLAQVSLHIVQRFIIMPTSSTSPQQTFSRPPIPLECHHQSTPYPSSSSKLHTGGTLYEGEFQYKIPSDSTTTNSFLDHINNNGSNNSGLVPSIQANTVSDIKVEHHLLVYLTLTYPKMSHDGVLRRARRVFTFQCDFDLLHPGMADHMSNEFLKLPTYSDYPITTTTIYPTKASEDRLANEVFNNSRHHHQRPPMYDHAVLLPPAML